MPVEERKSFTKRFSVFKEKYLGKIGVFCSNAIAIASLVVGIKGLKASQELSWRVVLGIVIFNSILWILVSVYETILFYKGSSLEKKLMKEKQDLEKSLNELERVSEEALKVQEKVLDGAHQQVYKDLQNSLCQVTSRLEGRKALDKKVQYYNNYIINSLIRFTGSALAIAGAMNKEIDEIEEFKKQALSSGSSEEFVENEAKLRIGRALERYKKSILDEFNHFLGNIVSKVKWVLDEYLEEKEIKLQTSISVKQFNRIITNSADENLSDVGVITTYRDNQTYRSGKREVGGIRYTIDGNSDFRFCLTHNSFLKNNIKEGDQTYANEHEGHLSMYNCTIVVPIKYDYPEFSRYFGYLTCDVLNQDFGNEDILDEDMVEIMHVAASIIGIYLDNMDFQWDYILDSDLLDMVYRMKYDSRRQSTAKS